MTPRVSSVSSPVFVVTNKAGLSSAPPYNISGLRTGLRPVITINKSVLEG